MKTLLSVLLLCSCALAQSYTVVTATLQDSSGQVWSNASWRTEFAPQPGYSGQYNNQGSPITVAQSGTADNVGTFHVTLDNNIVVSPAGSAWKFIICPNASVSACNTINLTIFGPVMNVSSQINNILTIPVVVASPVIAHAYNDTEVSGSYGTLYINALDNTLRECLILQCNGGGWVAISASTSNPTFTGTLTVPCVKFNFDASNDSTLCSQGATGHINFLLPTTGGTLLTSGTAGNVSNSGTPLNHQIASWIDATHIQGINPTSNSGWVLTSNGLASDPSFQALPGGGNVSNSGTPLNHQVALWTDATHVQGQSPSTAGFVLTSNGIGSDPTFQAPSGGGATASFMLSDGAVNSLASISQVSIGNFMDTANKIAFLRFTLLATVTFTQVDGSFSCGLGSCNDSVAIYNSTGTTVLFQSGAMTVPNGSNVTMSFSVSSTTLSPGSYIFAWSAENGGNNGVMGWQNGIATLAFHSGTGNGNILNQSTIFLGVAGNTSSASVFPATLTISGGGARGYAATDNFNIPALLFH